MSQKKDLRINNNLDEIKHDLINITDENLKNYLEKIKLLNKNSLKSLIYGYFSIIVEKIKDSRSLIKFFENLEFFKLFKDDMSLLKNIFNQIKSELQINYDQKDFVKELWEYLYKIFNDFSDLIQENIIELFILIYSKEISFQEYDDNLLILESNFEILDFILEYYYIKNRPANLLDIIIEYLILKYEFEKYHNKFYFNNLENEIYNDLSKKLLEKWNELSLDKKKKYKVDFLQLSTFLTNKLKSDNIKIKRFTKRILTNFAEYKLSFSDIINYLENFPKSFDLNKEIFSEEIIFNKFIENLKEDIYFNFGNLNYLIQKEFFGQLYNLTKNDITQLILNIFKNSNLNLEKELYSYFNFLEEFKTKIFTIINHEEIFKENLEFINKPLVHIKEFFIIIESLKNKDLRDYIEIFFKYLKFFIGDWENRHLNLISLIVDEKINTNNQKFKNLILNIQRILSFILNRLEKEFHYISLDFGYIFSYLIYLEYFLNVNQNFELRENSFINEISNLFFQKLYQKFSLHFIDSFEKIKFKLILNLDLLQLHFKEYLNKDNREDYHNLKSIIIDKINRPDNITKNIKILISKLKEFLKKPFVSILFDKDKKVINYINFCLKNKRVIIALPILLVEIEIIILNLLNIISKPDIRKLRGLREKINRVNKFSDLEIFHVSKSPYNLLIGEENTYLNLYCDKRNEYFHSKNFPNNDKILSLITYLDDIIKTIYNLTIRNLCLLYLSKKGIIQLSDFIIKIMSIDVSNNEITIKIKFENLNKCFSINIEDLNNFIENFTR